MAGRILNRRELRKQADQAEQTEAAAAAPDVTVAPPKAATRRKAAATPTVRKPRKSKAPPRMRVLWCVYDGGMKEVALFDYNQRAAAEEKLSVMLGKQKGVYFLQLVKQPMPALETTKAP
ncbi:MAG: hypothetical protein ACYC3I_05085 [Gemmataceae bacterium]